MSRMPTIVQMIPERGISPPFVSYVGHTRCERAETCAFGFGSGWGGISGEVGGLGAGSDSPRDFAPERESSPPFGIRTCPADLG